MPDKSSISSKHWIWTKNQINTHESHTRVNFKSLSSLRQETNQPGCSDKIVLLLCLSYVKNKSITGDGQNDSSKEDACLACGQSGFDPASCMIPPSTMKSDS